MNRLTRAVAVDPSVAAIADGLTHFPHIDFRRGLASDIPADERFDLVIVNFVLHWVSRSLLLRAISEIDRVINPGGHLVIGDFLPSHPTMVHYHHALSRGIMTYKQDYSAIFVEARTYRRIALWTADHDDNSFQSDTSSHDRIGVALLRKDLDGEYSPHQSAIP